MSKVRVPLHGKPQGFATIDPAATKGATVGVDLYWKDGALVTPEELDGLTHQTNVTNVTGGVNTQPTVSLWSLLQNIPANITALAALAGAGLVTRLADNSFVVRTLEGVAGRIVVTNGNGAINPTIDLATLADGGGGTLQRFARDTYGRVSGTSAATTDHLTEGATNLYYTDARARAGVLATTIVDGDLTHAPDGNAVFDALALKAPLASPAFTGTPTAPTAAAATNTTQVATTAFVQTVVGTAVTGLLELKGDIDASANPNYPAASKGDLYLVTVAGRVGGASGKQVEIGDSVVAKADNTGGTEAAVGTSWFVLEHNLVGALLTANNLSDLSNAATARTNLGLGTMSTQNANAVAITGGTLLGVTAVHAGSSSGTSYAFLGYRNSATEWPALFRQDNASGKIAEFQFAGASVADFTSTGLNACAIGATTRSTGAFTTTSAVRGANGDVSTWQGASTAKVGYLYSDGTYVGIFDAAATAGNGFLFGEATPKVYCFVNGAIATTTSATGLTVTGAVSATTNLEAGTAVLVSNVFAITAVTTASQTRTLDLSNGAVQTLSINQSCLMTFTGPAGKAGHVVLYVYNSAASASDVTSSAASSNYFAGDSVTVVSVANNATTALHMFWDGTRAVRLASVTPGAGTGDRRPT